MSGQQSTAQAKFPKWMKRPMREIAGLAQGLYQDEATAQLPGLNDYTTQGLDQRAEMASGGESIANPGLAEANRILGGEYLDVTQNPAFQRNMEAAMGAASSRFAGSGRVGSGAYAGAMGDAATGVAAQMYDQERQRQMGTLSMMPQLIQSQYADSAALEDVGRAYDEDTMARFDWPYARLDRYANTIYGSPASQIPSTTNRTPFSWDSAITGLFAPR